MDKSFHLWVDLASDSTRNTPDWFRYFLQRAFVESHSIYPEEKEIENWVDGLLLILRGMKLLGPYKTAFEELKDGGLGSEKFKRYFNDFYMDLFFQAVELTGIYWRMVFELYDPPGNVLQISDKMRKRFRRVVQNADLSSPLQKDVLGDAKKAFYTGVPRKLSALVRTSQKRLNKKQILKINPKDVGKFER